MKRQWKIGCLVWLCMCHLVCAWEMTSDWVVVCAKDARPRERKAAQEVVKYIAAVSGMKLPVVDTAPSGRQAITVRKGRFSGDEWHVKRTADGLLISGGMPNGVLYGAYEFIERGLGCRFLAKDVEIIPKRKRLVFSESFFLSGKPYFRGREVYPGVDLRSRPDFHDFMEKCRINMGYSVRGLNCHTFHLYSKSFPADKPEYLALSKNGKRERAVGGSGPGGICLSHPEVRRLVVKKMSEMIEADRRHMRRYQPDRPDSNVIDCSANDSDCRCFCPDCQALLKKYRGSQSAVLLDFINDVAERLDRLYPGFMVQTFAYTFTEEPPPADLIRPRDNVIMQLAQLGAEFSCSTSKRDSERPLNHPNNRRALKMLQGWSQFGTPLRMWDYSIIYCNYCAFPYTNVFAIGPNLRCYAENKVQWIFTENEFMGSALHGTGNFFDLSYYLEARLMIDPMQDEKALIAEYLDGYYGPAAKEMGELLEFLGERMAREPKNLGQITIGARYFTEEFFRKADELFCAAEKKAEGNPVLLQRISQERVPFDTALFNLYRRLGMKLDRHALVDRLERNLVALVRRYRPANEVEESLKTVRRKCAGMRMDIPLPPQFLGKNVVDFSWIKFPEALGYGIYLVNDADAMGGKALKLTGFYGSKTKADPKFHARELEFGLYDPENKIFMNTTVVPRKKMATDEKFHWYQFGPEKLCQNVIFWLHWTWEMGLPFARAVYNPLSPDTRYTIYLSIKLQGPSYSPGSRQQDAILLDRVIFVRE